VREVRLALPTAWDLDWEGRVIDSETLAPIAGAEVEVLADHPGKNVDELPVLGRERSGPGGHVYLRLPAGVSTVMRARAPGYSWSGIALETGSVFVLSRPAAVEATVIGADGEPAAGIEVRLYRPASAFALSYVEWLADRCEWLLPIRRAPRRRRDRSRSRSRTERPRCCGRRRESEPRERRRVSGA
jgi:hypothetical protein